MPPIADQTFECDGILFTLSVKSLPNNLFLSCVRYQSGLAGVECLELPPDAEPYGSEAEAWRHARQQAVRWVHERTGDGQGRY